MSADTIRVEDHLPLAHALIRRGGWAGIAAAYGIGYDDLLQESALALMRAARSYDPSLGSFYTYAGWWIRARLGRYMSLHHAPVRLPVGIQEQRRAAGESSHLRIARLDAPLGSDGEDGTMHDLIGAPEPEHDRDDLPSDSLEDLIQDTPALSEREALVLRLRAAGKTLQEIGAELGGISRERVRQIEEQAIDLVRRAAGVRVATELTETKAPPARALEVTDALKREVAQLRGQGLGLHAVARRLGMSHQAVKAVERELLARIAAALEPAA